VLSSSSRCEWLCGCRRQTELSDVNALDVVAVGGRLDCCSCTCETVLYVFLVCWLECAAAVCFHVSLTSLRNGNTTEAFECARVAVL